MKLILDRITKSYSGKTAVNGVSATLVPGVTGLLGANGAGKTTLLRIICDILQPTGGRVLYDGEDIRELGPAYRSLLGYLPQDFGYYPSFTALDFMCYMGALKGFDKREAREAGTKLLEEVGLGDDVHRKVKTFSGGMKQRLGIAQAMLGNPAILVLDEPTAGLDPKERVRFRNLIAGFAQDRIVLLSTHIVSDIEFAANRILVMNEGMLIMDGAPEHVVAQAAGKVWECTVDAQQAEEMTEQMPVVNVRYAPDGHAVVRVVTDTSPMEGAVAVDPTLEDLYLYVFRTDGNQEVSNGNAD
ncbi:ABC transporter ATP-binding protein [Slackia heliotrinireducens]|uniref:ABC transporter ATP-binding protein n=1 Tax=Slackia heliotrinireducens TaxID=84110 RepID=UPI0033163139